MLLPELNVPVSIEIFESHVEYFIRGFVASDQLFFSHKKIDLLYGGYRYNIYCSQEVPNNSASIKIGTIDILIVHTQKVNIKTAIYNFENIREAIDFFDKFYLMIFKNWDETPYYGPGYVDGKNVVKETLFGVASSTGIVSMFFTINRILDRMPNSQYTQLMDFAISLISDNTFSQKYPEYKEEILQYQLEINKGLIEFSQVGLLDEKPKHGVHEKTRLRAERLKKIKDARPYLSQPLTVSEYNEKYEGDDFISLYDLRNTYSAMGWKWQRADRSK